MLGIQLLLLFGSGFGDFVPAHRLNAERSIALCSLYLLFGIALLAMSFNLVQEEVINNVKSVAKRLGIIKDERGDEDEDFEDDFDYPDDDNLDNQEFSWLVRPIYYFPFRHYFDCLLSLSYPLTTTKLSNKKNFITEWTNNCLYEMLCFLNV